MSIGGPSIPADKLHTLLNKIALPLAERLAKMPRYFGHFITQVGENVDLSNAFFNLACGNVIIGSNVWLGYNVNIITGTHDVQAVDGQRQARIPLGGRDIIIENGVFIGTNATVLGPCRIGRHAVIAAGSVVTSDVRAGWLYAGVPARPIRKVILLEGINEHAQLNSMYSILTKVAQFYDDLQRDFTRMRLRSRVDTLYFDNMISQMGDMVIEDGRRIFQSRDGKLGFLLFGPYCSLPAGQYRAKFQVKINQKAVNLQSNSALIEIDVMGSRTVSIARRLFAVFEVPSKEFGEMAIDFMLSDYAHDVEFRLRTLQDATIFAYAAVVIDKF